MNTDSHVWWCVGGGIATGVVAGVTGAAAAFYLYRKFGGRAKKGTRVAIVLSGCGVYDGSEITETVSVLVKCSQAGAEVQCFAPDRNQMHVVDHQKGTVRAYAPRNVLSEAARIARGDILALSELNADDYSAVIFPGGFGVAKNLSTWAVDGANCTVDAEVERVIRAFTKAHKPIGMCCIAPVLAAKVLPGCTLTVGCASGDKWPYAGTVPAVQSLGCQHVEMPVDGVCIDPLYNLITAPAYMYDGKASEIFDSVSRMVGVVLSNV